MAEMERTDVERLARHLTADWADLSLDARHGVERVLLHLLTLPVDERMAAMGMRAFEVTDDDLRTTDGSLFWSYGLDKRVWVEADRG